MFRIQSMHVHSSIVLSICWSRLSNKNFIVYCEQYALRWCDDDCDVGLQWLLIHVHVQMLADMYSVYPNLQFELWSTCYHLQNLYIFLKKYLLWHHLSEWMSTFFIRSFESFLNQGSRRDVALFACRKHLRNKKAPTVYLPWYSSRGKEQYKYHCASSEASLLIHIKL